MRVCDLIAEFLEKNDITDVFMVSGGGLMFLTDGLACNPNINVTCCHHEQAVAMSTVGYSKYKKMACGYVTTGCGGTNAVTGVLNAWQDSTACIFISGQVKLKETIRGRNLSIRQLGVQEADIIKIIESITKYSVMITNPEDTLYHLEKAICLAKTGRPGPVWIDVPMDIQSAEIDKTKLKHFNASELEENKTKITEDELNSIITDLNNAKRPIIIAGQGIRLSESIDKFNEFVHKHNIPFVCSRMGTDVLPTEDKLNIGRIGNKGMRSANFAVQNADYVLSLGSRLSVSSTGQEYEYFVRDGKLTVVDIDQEEHEKNTVKIDELIIADLADLFEKLSLDESLDYNEWAKICYKWKEKYPVCLDEYYDDSEGINLYVFIEELSKYLKDECTIIGDAGSAVYVPPQGLKTKNKKQRYITSGAQAEMGFTLPASVGVAIASNKDVYAITGDGSLQMNLQELQTLVHYNLPVKLFVWNNDGYLSIRATQNKFFNGRFIGTDKNSGVSFPDLEKISSAYGIKYEKISKINEFEKVMSEINNYDGPVLIEVMCIPNQLIIPTVSSKKLEDGTLVSSPIEDMFPFLPRDEFKENMINEPLNQ